MSSEGNVNTVIEELNGISAELFCMREDIGLMPFEKHQEDAVKRVQRCNGEIIMLIDDIIAIMVDELGAKFGKETVSMEPFEFYFSDLTEDAQSRYLEFLKVNNAEEANMDMNVIPIFEIYSDEVVDIQEELFPEDETVYDDKDRT